MRELGHDRDLFERIARLSKSGGSVKRPTDTEWVYADPIAPCSPPVEVRYNDGTTDVGTVDEISPAFVNGHNIGDPYPPLSFRIDEEGDLHYRIACTGLNPGDLVTVFPLDYRPSHNERLVGPTEVAGLTCTYELATDGTLTFLGFG